jgi:23S rRNA (cytidine1920-2'-O)/16S rRNA (cytidine1409-2'-O)-methyltransferase
MDRSSKVRIDTLLVQRGWFASREAAKRAIMAGLVKRNGLVVDKPGTSVRTDDDIEVQVPEHTYVSRGGLKLERALKVFPVQLAGRVVVDVGASTGGFTDCALRHGAQLVYAVDVGYGQLDWKLRTNPSVVVMERTNFRHIDPARFDPRPDAAVMDVSFISTRLLWPKLLDVLRRPADVISLVKPQFEAGREAVGKGGIVRDPGVHVEVLAGLIRFAADLGVECGGIDYSPITGGDGNIEYLTWWRVSSDSMKTSVEAADLWKDRCREVVRTAWAELKQRDVTEAVNSVDLRWE